MISSYLLNIHLELTRIQEVFLKKNKLLCTFKSKMVKSPSVTSPFVMSVPTLPSSFYLSVQQQPVHESYNHTTNPII